MRPSRLVLRLSALAGTLVLLTVLVAAPAAAARPVAPRAAGHTLDRGHVNVKAAAARAAGVTRDHKVLRVPRHQPRKHASVDRTAFSRASVTSRIASATPVVATTFSGIGEAADSLGLEPPDPWVAVSGSYVVQSTNGLIRISNRAGAPLQSIPTWALFSLAPGEIDSDPRILWDAAKGRWVGVVLSFSVDEFDELTSAYLNVAVSDGADPQAGWRIFSYFYTDTSELPSLPDFPGLSTSGDKIVLTANEYDSTLTTFLGGSMLVIRWSDVLAGTFPSPSLWTFADPDLDTPRPAINQGTTNDVHLIALDEASGNYIYARLSGIPTTAPGWTDISGLGAGYCEATPPRQPGSPDTITTAVDGRPTDAVWRSNLLAFVSTCSVTGADLARISMISTPGATATFDTLLGPGGTTDAYMGGIGFARDGSLFTTYTQSSDSDYPSAVAAVYSGGTWYDAGITRAGTATYQGTRWGDYVGVAQDPTGTGAVWTGVEVPDPDGSWETHVQRLVSDTGAPTTTGPVQRLYTGTTLGTYSLPVRLSWTSADTGSSVARTNLFADQFHTGLVTSGSTPGATTVRNNWWKDSSDPTDYSYQYAAQAVDAAGNTSGIVTGSRLTAVVYQQTRAQFSFGSGWHTQASSKFSGGSTKYSSTVGASVTFRTSARSFGFVSTRASSRGKVKVYLDGTYKGTVTLTSSATAFRRLMYAANFSSSSTHSVKLVVRSGRVDVDAFVLLK